MAEIKQIKIEAVGLRNIKKELDDIKKSMKDVTDPSEMDRLTKEADKLEKQLKDVNKGIKEMDESTSSVTNSSKTLKQELRDLENEMLKLYHTGQNNTEEFMKMQQAAADMRSSISNMNRETSLLGANDAPQQVAAGWKNVGTSLKNLDFATAAKDAERLNILTKTMSFDVVTNSLKNLGKTFASLGKALLTNPYFLLAAVVAGIIYVVKELLEELEVLDDVMAVLGKTLEWTMKPLTLLIKGLEQLVYWIGLIDPEAKAAAKAQIEAAEESAKAYEDAADDIKKSTDKTIQALDHQIKMAELNGESTVILERKKLVAMTETAEAEMDAAKARLEAAKLSGDLDAAEMKALQDKVHEYELAYDKIKNTIVEFETRVSNERKEAAKAEQERIDKENVDRAAKAKAWAEKQEAIRKQEAANRLAAQRLEEDLELQLMEEGDAKLLKQNQLKYERLIEDTKSNEKLNAEEKARVIAQYEKLAEEKTEEIRNATKKKEEAAAIQAQEELSALLYDLKTSDEQKVLDELDQYYEESLEKLREHLENDLITKEEFAEAEILLAQEKADRIEEIERKSEEAIRAEKQATLETNLDIAAAYAGAVNDLAAGIFEMSNNLGEQDEKAKEERAKKQFKVQKALNLVMAGIDGARAITTSLAAAPLAIGPVPNPAGIASLVAVAANTAATIAAIASKQYTGSGGGGGSPVKPNTSISSGSSTPTRQAPIVNFQGTGSNRNEVSAGGGSSNITIENNVSVSETEITDKQKTVHNLTNQSQL